MKRATLIALTLALTTTPAHANFGYIGQIAAGTGDGDGQFSEPRGLDADGAGNVYVADFRNNRIQKLDANGNFLTKWGTFGSGNGQFARPFDVAVDSADNVYVAEHAYDSTPGGNHRVQKFDSSGGFLLKWGSPGGADGQFAGLLGIATDPADNVYVVENNRVQKFNPNGGFLLKWGSPGFGPGQFRGLSGIAVSETGTVYTLESENRRVQRFDATGTPLGEFAVSQTDKPDCLLAIEVDAANYVYVASGCTGIEHFRRFAPDGTLAEIIGPCNGGYNGVAAHPSGKIYASFAAAASAQSGVVVFGEGGGACPAPPPPPPGGGDPGPGGSSGLVFSGAEGVTINAGAQFTNDPAVELTIAAPGSASMVKLSNDGGFLTATDRPPEPSGQYAWELAQSGQERLPKTVYVRFTGPGGTAALTFSDDIILDQTAPTISSASLTDGTATTTAAAAAKTRKRRYTLRVNARDNASGVGRIQLATTRRSRPGKLQPYKRKLTVRSRSAPRYVRVRDRAGNYSRWRRLKVSS